MEQTHMKLHHIHNDIGLNTQKRDKFQNQ